MSLSKEFRFKFFSLANISLFLCFLNDPLKSVFRRETKKKKIKRDRSREGGLSKTKINQGYQSHISLGLFPGLSPFGSKILHFFFALSVYCGIRVECSAYKYCKQGLGRAT